MIPYTLNLEQVKQEMSDNIPEETANVFRDDARSVAERYPQPLKVAAGDMVPAFELPNATAQDVSLENLLVEGPVVIVFYRGAWCPYCNLQLETYKQLIPDLEARNATLVAISPQTPDHSLSQREKENLDYEILSDVGNRIARQYTTVYAVDEMPKTAMGKIDIDFDSYYADDLGELPVPAVFVIGQNRRVQLAATEGGDYSQRVEPAAILEALQTM